MGFDPDLVSCRLHGGGGGKDYKNIKNTVLKYFLRSDKLTYSSLDVVCRGLDEEKEEKLIFQQQKIISEFSVFI